jgi:hypothetical protein
MQQGLGMMQMQTEAMELKPRMAMQQLPPSLLQERTVSMCQKAVSLKLAAALKQTKASWAGEQITAGTSLGTKLFLRHLLAMVSWTQVVFAQGSCCVSPTCLDSLGSSSHAAHGNIILQQIAQLQCCSIIVC